jgi:hypothetical protein
MALTNQDIVIYAGETKDVNFALSDSDNNPLNISGTLLAWAFGVNTLDIARGYKSTPTVSGITITNASSGWCTVRLNHDDTINYQGNWYHELRIQDPSGNLSTVAVGTLTINSSILN